MGNTGFIFFLNKHNLIPIKTQFVFYPTLLSIHHRKGRDCF